MEGSEKVKSPRNTPFSVPLYSSTHSGPGDSGEYMISLIRSPEAGLQTAIPLLLWGLRSSWQRISAETAVAGPQPAHSTDADVESPREGGTGVTEPTGVPFAVKTTEKEPLSVPNPPITA